MNEPLDLAFAALADPTRRAILRQLSQGEASVGDIAAQFRSASQPYRAICACWKMPD